MEYIIRNISITPNQFQINLLDLQIDLSNLDINLVNLIDNQ